MKKKCFAPLNDGQLALLAWLARAPFLRAEDLARELNVSAAQAYRHLDALSQRGLIQQVRRPACRMYALTAAGAHALAQSGESAWTMSDRLLLSLLPRLDQFAWSQALVHRLLTHAPRFFAEDGRAAEVQWTWIRDWEQSLSALPRQGFPDPARAFADWLLLLRVRTPRFPEQLYPLFLMLDQECFPPHVIRQRLRGLVHARHLAMKHHPQACAHFPLVLIVLPGWHRARHWQRHAAELIRDHVPALRGCLAVVAPRQSGRTSDLWQLPWQALHRYGPCNLRGMVVASSESLLPNAWIAARHHQNGRTRSRKPGQRLSLSRSLEQRMRWGEEHRPAALTRETVGLLGLTLTQTHYRLLEQLLDHPFVSKANLAAFLRMQEPSVQRVLAALRQCECVVAEPLGGDPTSRWRLSSHGLSLLALRHHVLLSMLADHDDQQGLEALRRRAHHLVGVYSFFAQLAQEAARRDHFFWWETGYAREQVYYALSRSEWKWHQPHGIGEYQVGQRRIRFWLEWQAEWSHSEELRRRFEGYASSIRSLEWRREGHVLPVLLLVCPAAREKQMQRIGREILDSLRLLFLSTTRELLETHGPLTAIWLPAFMGEEARRRRFYELENITLGGDQ